MSTPKLCECAKLHYSLAHYFAVHGDYLDVREHRTQVEVFENGTIADLSKIKDNQEIPPTIIKWVCKFCGKFNTSSNPTSHKSTCEFIKYLKFRETTPYRISTPTYSLTKTPLVKSPSTPKYIAPEPEKKLKTIANIRQELINTLVSSEANNILWSTIREDSEDKPREYFEQEWTKIPIETKEKSYKRYRTYIYFLKHWEELEADSSYQPLKSRTILDWYLLGEFSHNHYQKLKKLDELDPTQKYKLDELLTLIPQKKETKPEPKPENAPLNIQIQNFISFFNQRLILHSFRENPPPFLCGEEINRVGNQNNHWQEDSWEEYLEKSSTAQNEMKVYTDLELRKNSCKYVFAEVVLDYLIDKKDKHGLESFRKNYQDANEKAVYENEPRKTQIANIISGKHSETPTELGKFLYYDELFTGHERYYLPEKTLVIEPFLTREQWEKIDNKSDLKKGVLELRKYSDIKKLVIKTKHPFLGAPAFKKIDINTTAEKLEELEIKPNDYLQELILGDKPQLKKIDIRQTKIKYLNLKQTKITHRDYDTLNFPIRLPNSETKTTLKREKKETDWEYQSRIYKLGSIVSPFKDFTDYKQKNIIFCQPWINEGRDWTNITLEFKEQPQNIQGWIGTGFTFEAVREWIGIGLNTKDYDLAKWLRDVKNWTPEWVNNNCDETELRKEFAEYKSG